MVSNKRWVVAIYERDGSFTGLIGLGDPTTFDMHTAKDIADEKNKYFSYDRYHVEHVSRHVVRIMVKEIRDE